MNPRVTVHWVTSRNDVGTCFAWTPLSVLRKRWNRTAALKSYFRWFGLQIQGTDDHETIRQLHSLDVLDNG